MFSSNEAHCNNLEDHLTGVNDKEDLIDYIHIVCDEVDLFISGEHDTVDHDDEENELVKQWVHCNNLDNLVAERICHW